MLAEGQVCRGTAKDEGSEGLVDRISAYR
jgi:hypothetical protein